MGFGPWEVLIVLVVLVIIFGAGRLTNVSGAVGKSIREFRNAVQDAPKAAPAAPPIPTLPPLVFDPEPYAGVLPALAAGLAQASGDVCLAVACDMPFVSAKLFARLLELQSSTSADVVIPRTAEYLEPMHAVYRRLTVKEAIE